MGLEPWSTRLWDGKLGLDIGLPQASTRQRSWPFKIEALLTSIIILIVCSKTGMKAIGQ